LLMMAAACAPDPDAAPSQTNDPQQDAATAPGPDLDARAAAAVQAALDARAAEIEAAVQRLPGLIGSIRSDMRRYLNAEHVAAAQRSGVAAVRDSAHLMRLVGSKALVELSDSTHWWVLRELDQSRPYVTPHTREVLEEMGRRFHARLEEHGLPPFRFDITSVLRTEDQQEALRRRNRNASQTTSSHEFGTTFDIAYLNFAAPRVIEDPAAGRLDARLRAYATMRLDTIGTRYAPHLEGELGAVLQEMQREGTIMTLRERSQPVYHTTVVR
ncbi:MAG TPA: DUF5715 family protein, partial [Longimicrobiales bacterium]|nr:DUF5715 family protein [Longimicrobiales bacterium]